MRTSPPRRDDGKFGTGSAGSAATSARPVRGRPFPKGADNPSTGRKKGSRNKLLAQMEELKNLPGVPEDPLEFLAYVQMNPENLPWINWDLRTRAASERARYKYARKHEDRITHSVGEETLRQITEEGRENARKERERRAAEQMEKEQKGSPNEAS